MEPYLVAGLPMIDILVLDEADRMIADGHFKELKSILNHVYTQRVEYKKEAIARKKIVKEEKKTGVQTLHSKMGMDIMKDKDFLNVTDSSEMKKHFNVG